ncbi:MarR family transcriptional regulator [Gordonia jinghuaiqii]|uniref:MarR family transcriptional regulator n=1 Tax=Gordonia jinghuaiqii TaxID=2758710 RepID=A0A7D7LSY9_9ACTN|nr:MarR family transcriptional regulator [Gordonia jinghuaiqii]MCR5978371.1 MarR family transcriptional regulator [Gordonia jinghuaiqii]QMT01197.1 MarR family transcriptional regulator [Gordonia jinghuaiqii]
MTPSADDAAVPDLTKVEDLLQDLMTLRRTPRYRQLLVEGTGLDGRVTTMRVLRTVDVLARSGMSPSVGDLAQRLGMEHSNTSRTVDSVVDQGLLDKRKSTTDGRRFELTLTPRGERAIRELDDRRAKIHAEMTKGWRPDEVATLVELLEKLSSAYADLQRSSSSS